MTSKNVLYHNTIHDDTTGATQRVQQVQRSLYRIFVEFRRFYTNFHSLSVKLIISSVHKEYHSSQFNCYFHIWSISVPTYCQTRICVDLWYTHRHTNIFYMTDEISINTITIIIRVIGWSLYFWVQVLDIWSVYSRYSIATSYYWLL